MSTTDSDRELLELAAKAAGIEICNYVERICNYYSPWGGKNAFELKDGGYWNALVDDGDALRLAVKLHISVLSNIIRVEASTIQLTLDRIFVHESTLTQEEGSATRRAIVRAAASIGKEMKE